MVYSELWLNGVLISKERKRLDRSMVVAARLDELRQKFQSEMNRMNSI